MGCRPLCFLIGLPFALVSLVLSLVGAVVWVIGTVLSCLCPCCICFSGLANYAVSLVKLPVTIMKWFIDPTPCCICFAGLANFAVSLVMLPVNIMTWFIDLISLLQVFSSCVSAVQC